MNILLIGSGGREHALAWKISQSNLLKTLYCSPGNGGTQSITNTVTLDTNDHQSVIDFCREKSIDLVVIGPEDPLVSGLSNSLTAENIPTFGPSKEAAQLEGSKGFTKDICAKYNIPTAGYGKFDNPVEAINYIQNHPMPVVIKADGLAAGKGVIIAQTRQEAEAAITDMFEGSFGKAGARIVIEEFLEGEEASFFVLSDGINSLPLGSAQDHKAVGEGDTGPNTGGMGAYSPAPVMTKEMEQRVLKEIINPTLAAMTNMGHPFKGVLFAGLMITSQGPKLIEYNVRFGDPECQVLMTRMKSDIIPALFAAAKGQLDSVALEWNQETAITIVLANKGYPNSYQKGSEIKGIDQAEELSGVKVFHAGTKIEDQKILAVGGRVLNVTATGTSVTDAQQKAYKAVDAIDWPQGFCRRDIGWRAIQKENK